MGVWRDPSCGRSHELKKRARFERGRWKKRMRNWQLALPKKVVCALDDRPANGCHRNCTVIGTIQAAGILGIRGLLVHALNDKAKAFYEHYGFKSSATQPMTLVLSIKNRTA